MAMVQRNVDPSGPEEILDLLEEAEDPLAVVGLDPGSRIRDANLGPPLAPGHLDSHRRVGW